MIILGTEKELGREVFEKKEKISNYLKGKMAEMVEPFKRDDIDGFVMFYGLYEALLNGCAGLIFSVDNKETLEEVKSITEETFQQLFDEVFKRIRENKNDK